MIEVPAIAFEPDNVSQELKQRRQWINWRYDIRDGKLVKIPLAPWATGHNGAASATDPANMTTFPEAVAHAKKNGWGIGFAFFPGDKISGIDLEEVNDEVRRLIAEAGSYTETSPSGEGVHIIGYGKLSKAIKKEEVEAYDRDRFFTVTGHHVEGAPKTLHNIQHILDELERKYAKPPPWTGLSTEPPAKAIGDFVNKYGWNLADIRKRDGKLDELLSGGLADLPSSSEADMSSLSKLLFWSYGDGDAVSILRHFRGREKLGRRDYLERTLSKLSVGETIANLVDVKNWNPVTGYALTVNVASRRGTPNKNKLFSPPPRGGYISPEPVEENINEESKKPMTLSDVEQVLDVTIKRDHENKLLVFLSIVMNYCGDDQQNILFNAPSSTGKSHIALEIAKLFPPEDVDKKGYTSPTSFFHVMGELCTLDGQPLLDRDAYVEAEMTVWEVGHPRPIAPEYRNKSREAIDARKELTRWKKNQKREQRQLKVEWNNIEKLYVVSLAGRILIFKDQPHDRVLQVLRSLLSHDEKVLEVDITDKTKEGGHRTKRIRVIGFPTVVFCSAQFSLDEQERTRFWMLSPDMTQSKLRASLKLQAERLSSKARFEEKLVGDVKRGLLMDRIRAIRAAHITEVIIPSLLATKLLEWFTGGRDLMPRDQRDFPRLLAIVKAHALFSMFQREREGSTVIAEAEDVEVAKLLLNDVIDANRLGLPPYVHKLYHESLKSSIPEEGISRVQFSRLYFDFYKERLGEKTRKRLLDLLSEAGLLEEQPDPNDKRKNKIYIPLEGVEKNKKIVADIASVAVQVLDGQGIMAIEIFREEMVKGGFPSKEIDVLLKNDEIFTVMEKFVCLIKRVCGGCVLRGKFDCPHGALVQEGALYAETCHKYTKGESE